MRATEIQARLYGPTLLRATPWAERNAYGASGVRGLGSSFYTRAVKLLVAVVHNEDARVLIDALLSHEYRATWLHSSGGFLKQSNATILVGVDDAKVDTVVELVRNNCKARTQIVSPIPPIMEPGEFFMPYPLEVEVGGAVIFVVPIDRFERI